MIAFWEVYLLAFDLAFFDLFCPRFGAIEMQISQFIYYIQPQNPWGSTGSHMETKSVKQF